MIISLGTTVIRDWRMEDAPSVARYADNRGIWLNLRDAFPSPYSLEDAEAFLSRVMAAHPRTVFAVARETEAIGSIGLVLGEDVQRKTAELGYWLAEPFWNLGITTAAVRAFTAWAFDAFGLVRIFAVPYARNAASIRVLGKAGFEREGVLRASAVKDGRILDQVLYAKIKSSF